jgi:hypothetical protein
LLGSVEKSRWGIAAGVLNATRQTGSVLGVALFGSLVGRSTAFIAGLHTSLLVSAGLLVAAAAAIMLGAQRWPERCMTRTCPPRVDQCRAGPPNTMRSSAMRLIVCARRRTESRSGQVDQAADHYGVIFRQTPRASSESRFRIVRIML